MLSDVKKAEQLNAQNIKGERAAKQRRESQVDAEGQIKEMYQMK